MNKHTNGPWRYERARDGWGILAPGFPDGRGWSTWFAAAAEEEMDANAALMAAAPELLNACHVALDFIDPKHSVAIEQIEDAIARTSPPKERVR